MKRLITLATVVCAASSLGVVTNNTPASAAGDPLIGMKVLDLLCVMRGGTAYNTPFTISRCQSARGKSDFVIEELICEGLLDGNFGAAPSHDRPSRTTWVCSPGQAAP